MPSERWVPWVVRALWAGLALAAGPALAAALDAASRPVEVVASLGLWLAWAAGVAASFIPHPASLTVLRVLAPAAVAAMAAAVLGGHGSALAVGWSAVAAGWVFAPHLGSWAVNGAAYPSERRFLLRPPAAVLFGPLGVAWALSVAGMAAGPLLLAARQWVVGALAVVVGFPLAFVLLRAVHGLSRRWAVFVPAGVVLVDPLTLAEPVLLRRASVTRLGPALVLPAGSSVEPVDLSEQAPGLLIEAVLADEVTLNVLGTAGRRRREPRTVRTTRVRFTPTRPGAFLDEARARNFVA
jgi:hypothetical protein